MGTVFVFQFILPRKYTEYATTQLKTASHLEFVSLIPHRKVRTRISTLDAVLNHASEMHRSLAEKFCPRQQSPNFNSWEKALDVTVIDSTQQF